LLFLSGTIVVNLKNTFSNEPCPDISYGCPIPLSCGIMLELEQKFAFFKGLPRSMRTADIRIAFAWFKELKQKGKTNTFFAYPTKNP